MPKITVHETEKVTVWCYPEKGIIHHQMHQYCYREPFRAALTAGVEAMREHRCDKWLSDDRVNGALAPDDEEWATKIWFPKARDAGWKFWAMVQPVQVVGQLNVTRFVKMYSELGITANMFSEPGPAFEWLEKQRST
jgi:hypothetical protein